MVKYWEIRRDFAASVEEFGKSCFYHPSFQKTYQVQRGDFDVIVGDWVFTDHDAFADGVAEWKQRRTTCCTVLKVPTSLARAIGAESSRATVTQCYGWKGDTLLCQQDITTEGVPFADLIVLHSDWRIEPDPASPQHRCIIKISGRSDCNGWAFGLKPIIGMVIHKQSKDAHEDWLNAASETCKRVSQVNVNGEEEQQGNTRHSGGSLVSFITAISRFSRSTKNSTKISRRTRGGTSTNITSAEESIRGADDDEFEDAIDISATSAHSTPQKQQKSQDFSKNGLQQPLVATDLDHKGCCVCM